MMSIFDPTLALTLLAHPFQVALTVLTFGALARSAKPMAAGLAYSVFSLVDLFLDKSRATVAIASTVAVVVVGILALVR